MWQKLLRLEGLFSGFEQIMATGSGVFLDGLEKLSDSCVSYYKENKERMAAESVREKRSELSHYVEVFHGDCGTLTPSVLKRIKDLGNGMGIVLMTAHQPNFFAYSGVLRKATLNYVLAKRLEELLGVPVVSFFGIADQDFTDDRWVRSCQLPAVQRSGGILSINVKLPEKMMLNQVAKPSPELLDKWKAEIEKWLNDSIRSVRRLCKAFGSSEMCSAQAVSILHENLGSFWDIVETSYERSERISDFNAFLISKIVNDVWGYDTLFSRFSECQQIFVDEFRFLLSHFGEDSKLLSEAKDMPCEEDISGGVSDEEPLLAPFWYHCDCGSKAKLVLTDDSGLLFGRGNCVGCGRSHELGFGDRSDPDVTDIASRISARAIPMALVFFRGLMPSCYVGGIAGVRYLMEAEHVASGLGISFPPIAVWRPRDEYCGVGQVEALLELERICKDLDADGLSEAKALLQARISEVHEKLDELEVSKKEILRELKARPEDEKLREEMKRLSIGQTKIKRSFHLSVINHEFKILENLSTVLELIPSIIDYAINVGLEQTSCGWVNHLLTDGKLDTDIRLNSVLGSSTSFAQSSRSITTNVC